jgi:peroxiredoxin
MVVSALLASCSARGSNGPQLVSRISGPLPPISGTTLAGSSVEPADYRGKVVVVNFWNPDCPPCRKEAPALRSDWATLRPLGVQFIGVVYVGSSWPDDPNAARAFLQSMRLDYPTIVDEGSTLARSAGIPGIPVTIVADASGRMRFQVLGGVKPGELVGLVSQLSAVG